jgi:hypothetical protein
MDKYFTTFRSLFCNMVVAGALPLVGCSSTVVTSDASVDSTPLTDTPITDSSRQCDPVMGPPSGCGTTVTYPCGNPPRLEGGGFDCTAICIGMAGTICSMITPEGSTPATFTCVICAVGRRVEGFVATHDASNQTVGSFFATISQLEAASVVAFERLAHELHSLGAPPSLIDRCLAAANDERRHTHLTGNLATVRDAHLAPIPPLNTHVRSLREVALDNAVEGCVRETFGALIATWQAAHASHDDIAQAMTEIAVDETRHAALSWSVGDWLHTQLCQSDRDAVATARIRAANSLLQELACPVDPLLVSHAGMPSADVSVRLAQEMFASLALAA